MPEIKEPPDTSWIKMETIRSSGPLPYAVAIFGIIMMMAMAAIVLLLGM